MSVRVAIIEDHPHFRRGLRAQLVELGHTVVGEAGDGIAAIELIQEVRPDVATVDLGVPEICGTELIQELRRRSPATKLLVVSGSEHEFFVRAARRAGANGYLAKTEPADQLARAIAAVLGSASFYCPRFVESVSRLPTETPPLETPQLEKLTPRERQVLRELADGATAIEVASRLELSPRTVEGYRTTIAKKLGIPDSRALVRFAAQNRALI